MNTRRYMALLLVCLLGVAAPCAVAHDEYIREAMNFDEIIAARVIKIEWKSTLRGGATYFKGFVSIEVLDGMDRGYSAGQVLTLHGWDIELSKDASPGQVYDSAYRPAQPGWVGYRIDQGKSYLLVVSQYRHGKPYQLSPALGHAGAGRAPLKAMFLPSLPCPISGAADPLVADTRDVYRYLLLTDDKNYRKEEAVAWLIKHFAHSREEMRGFAYDEARLSIVDRVESDLRRRMVDALDQRLPVEIGVAFWSLDRLRRMLARKDGSLREYCTSSRRIERFFTLLDRLGRDDHPVQAKRLFERTGNAAGPGYYICELLADVVSLQSSDQVDELEIALLLLPKVRPRLLAMLRDQAYTSHFRETLVSRSLVLSAESIRDRLAHFQKIRAGAKGK